MAGDEKKIAKNAGALYLRTAISLLIQLVATRYLLKYLGVDGLGLYGLVGSIVIIVESIKGLFSSSIQRFFNIELGKHSDNLKDIFNVAIRIIGTIAIGGTLLVFIGGLFVLPFLDIPADLQYSAQLILLCSSVTIFFHLINSVFDALIIAHEKFFYWAMVSISQSLLKLISVLALYFIDEWRVVSYAFFLMIIAFAVVIINILYCKKKFNEVVTFSKIRNKLYYKEIGLFTSYKLIGSVSTAVQSTGIDFILNLFGGLVVNTARTISFQVINAVNILVWNLIAGFSPRCITLYGEKRYNEFYRLVFLMMKCNLLINIVLGFTISLFINPILKLWLGSIPEYVSGFIRIIFLYFIVRVIQDALDMIFTAVGKLKGFELCLASTQILSLILGWLSLHFGAQYWTVFLMMTFAEIICVGVSLVLVKKCTDFDIKAFMQKILLPTIFFLAILIGTFAMVEQYITWNIDFLLLVPIVIIVFIATAIIGLVLYFGKNAFKQAVNIVGKKYRDDYIKNS